MSDTYWERRGRLVREARLVVIAKYQSEILACTGKGSFGLCTYPTVTGSGEGQCTREEIRAVYLSLGRDWFREEMDREVNSRMLAARMKDIPHNRLYAKELKKAAMMDAIDEPIFLDVAPAARGEGADEQASPEAEA